MVGYIFKKKSRGKTYYYAGESKRVGKTSKRAWEVYLGTFDKIVKTMSKGGVLLPDEASSTPYGLYSAFVKTAREIDFVNIVDQVYPKRDQGLSIGEYFLLGILARLTKPITKNSIKEWYRSKEIDKIYPINPGFLTVQNYWNNMASLDFEKMNRLHHLLTEGINRRGDNRLQTTYIYFDPTNFHTFIKTLDDTSTIPQNGNSKSKRFDLRQVNLALAVTRDDAIPIYHKTYPGNINDVTFFKENLESFIEHLASIDRKNFSAKKTSKTGHTRLNSLKKDIVIVFDKGNNAKVVFDKLSDHKTPAIRFIGSLRPSTQEEIFAIPTEKMSERFTTDSGNVVLYQEVHVKVYGKTFRGVLTYDEKTYQKKRHTWMANMGKVTSEVETFLDTQLNVKKWRKKEAVEKKLRRMLSKKGMKNVIQYEVNGEYGKLRVSLYCDIKAAEEKMSTWGKSLIFTSLKKEDNVVEIIKGYRLKSDIEECFKILNNSYLLSVRPVHHWNDQMIKAHMATCVLGLELIQLIRKKLKDAGIKMSIEEVFGRLDEISLIRLHYKNRKTVYKVGSMDKRTRKLAETLDVKLKT